jgi:hypothetical protein
MPAIRALKHGFVIAQIQDGFDIPYYRNYLIHPAPSGGFYSYAWMADEEKDAISKRYMRNLFRRQR